MPQSAGHRPREPFQTRPLTPATWPDLEELFGLPGGSIVRGCWCMYYREVVRRSPTRVVMRRALRPRREANRARPRV